MNIKKTGRMHIPFALPSIGAEEEQAVLEVLRSKWLTTGKITASFEKKFGEKIGVPHAIALNSATAGLHLAMKVLKIPVKSRVATSPFTFAASSEIIRYVGGHPLFLDTEEDSFNIDPDRIEEAFIKETQGHISGILPIHIAGDVCRMDVICKIARHYEVPVIEDAAHAFPSKTSSGYAGTLGDIGVFSFYATKPITTGEGGMVVTKNSSHAEQLKNLSLHGIDRIIWDRYQAQGPVNWEYDVINAGFKYNLTDLASAIGITQLEKADLFLEKRKKIADSYLGAFNGCDYLKLPPVSDSHSWHLFILRINDKKLTIDRGKYIAELMERGVGISVHFKPLHLMTYYKNKYGFKPADFPNALAHYTSCFSLPIYPGLTEEQVCYIIEQVKSVGEKYYKV